MNNYGTAFKTNPTITVVKESTGAVRGKSFHFAGEWNKGVHYINDDYRQDFVVYNNAFLVCSKSHLSSTENEPKGLLYLNGTVIGVNSKFWDFVISGPKGNSPAIRINPETGHWETKEDKYTDKEWTDTGIKAKMDFSDLTDEEIESLQKPGLLVVENFKNTVITQETGDNKDKVMSQKAVTDELNGITSIISDDVEAAWNNNKI